MRILPRAAFLALPAGTLFMKYEPCHFSNLALKGDTCETDFYVADWPWSDAWKDSQAFFDGCQAMQKGASQPADFECYGRDGCFEEDEWYLVYERADVERLIETLRRSL